jgi:hypothetical protein
LLWPLLPLLGSGKTYELPPIFQKIMAITYKQRQLDQQRRERLRQQGVCIVCGDNAAGINRDGTQSVRCPECAAKVTRFRRRQAAAAPGVAISADQIDDAYTVRVATARELIRVQMQGMDVKTVGAIVRELPTDYKAYVWSALKELKLDGVVDYCEYSPAPTRVYSQSMRRVLPKTISPYNRGQITPPDKTHPFPDVLFGESFKGQI